MALRYCFATVTRRQLELRAHSGDSKPHRWLLLSAQPAKREAFAGFAVSGESTARFSVAKVGPWRELSPAGAGSITCVRLQPHIQWSSGEDHGADVGAIPDGANGYVPVEAFPIDGPRSQRSRQVAKRLLASRVRGSH